MEAAPLILWVLLREKINLIVLVKENSLIKTAYTRQLHKAENVLGLSWLSGLEENKQSKLFNLL